MCEVERYLLAKCVSLMGEIFQNDAKLISDWWEFPHPYLGKKPRIAMVDGEIDRVIAVLEAMKSEIPS